MRALIVGIPVLKDTRRFHFEKGRRWTIVEHLVLEALAKDDWTLSALQVSSRLPRRVLLEILIRLMRVGWVELIAASGEIVFRSTALGRLNALREELPPVTRSAARFLGFAVDQLTGAIFRSRDISLTTQSQWPARVKGRPAVLLKAANSSYDYLQADIRGLADTLLEADEVLTRVDVTDSRPRSRIVLAAVRGQDVEGLGAEVPETLKAMLLQVAKLHGKSIVASPTPVVVGIPATEPRRTHRVRSISFVSEDLILDGDSHRKMLLSVLNEAHHQIVLHSTFIEMDRVKAILPAIRACAARGTRIDVLWGKSDEKDEVNKTRKAAFDLKKLMQHEGLDDRVRFHQSPTQSHSKMVIYDRGEKNVYEALVGSCNWLSTGFQSFDATVRLRDPTVVADVAFDLAELARPRDGQIPTLSSELARLGHYLEAQPGVGKPNGVAQLALGAEHMDLIHSARDESKSEIILLSHRLGVAAKPLLAAVSAAAQNGVKPIIYYGRVSGPVKRKDARKEADALRVDGVELVPIRKPRIHAKVLCWDDDNLVITSLNWLSADPSTENMRQEIGVHISAPGIAKNFRSRFASAKNLDGE